MSMVLALCLGTFVVILVVAIFIRKRKLSRQQKVENVDPNTIIHLPPRPVFGNRSTRDHRHGQLRHQQLPVWAADDTVDLNTANDMYMPSSGFREDRESLSRHRSRRMPIFGSMLQIRQGPWLNSQQRFKHSRLNSVPDPASHFANEEHKTMFKASKFAPTGRSGHIPQSNFSSINIDQ